MRDLCITLLGPLGKYWLPHGLEPIGSMNRGGTGRHRVGTASELPSNNPQWPVLDTRQKTAAIDDQGEARNSAAGTLAARIVQQGADAVLEAISPTPGRQGHPARLDSLIRRRTYREPCQSGDGESVAGTCFSGRLRRRQRPALEPGGPLQAVKRLAAGAWDG